MSRTIMLLGSLSCAVLAAGCGSSSKSVSGTTGARSAASALPANSTAVNPNAPEVSPAGDIPDTQAYVPYRAADGSYTIKVPEGWSRASAGGATVFAASVNSIRLESSAAQRAPTATTATASEVPKLSSSNPDFTLQGVSTVTRPAGNVVKIAYLTRSAANPVTGKSTRVAVERYEFFHRGREVIVTLSAPQGADNVDPWRTVTTSLRFAR
jgi:hypothetical protein